MSDVSKAEGHFTIFTTRADTIFGVTFMVLAPESELVEKLTTPAHKAEVAEYIAYVKKRTELDRILATTKLWDGRTSALVVSATSAASVTVRITLSAGNQSNSYALQCLVRESLIDWMQREAPYALPRARVEIEQVEVTHDPEPEQVAQMAEEIVRRREQAEEEQARAEAEAEQNEAEQDESGEPAWSVTRLLRRARRERDRLLLRGPGSGSGS